MKMRMLINIFSLSSHVMKYLALLASWTSYTSHMSQFLELNKGLFIYYVRNKCPTPSGKSIIKSKATYSPPSERMTIIQKES